MSVVIFVLFLAATVCFFIEWVQSNPKVINTTLGLVFMGLAFMAWIWWISNHLDHAIF